MDTCRLGPSTLLGGVLVSEGYMNSSKVFWAPGRKHGTIDPANPIFINSFHQYRYTSYGANTAALGTGEYDLLNLRDGIAGGSINGMPLHLGDPSAPPASNMIMIAEGGWPAQAEEGAYRASPTAYYLSGSSYVLYNYQGAMPRVYVDGHANALGRSGTKLTNPTGSLTSYVRPTADDIGFSINGVTKLAFVAPKYFSGYWVISDPDTYRTYAPWYTTWRTAWK